MTNKRTATILLAGALAAGIVQAQRGGDPVYTKKGTEFKVTDQDATRMAGYGSDRRYSSDDKESQWRGAKLTAYKMSTGGGTARGVQIMLTFGFAGRADFDLAFLQLSELNSVRKNLVRLGKVTQKRGFWSFKTNAGVAFSTYEGTAAVEIGRARVELGSSVTSMAQALQKSHAEARAL